MDVLALIPNLEDLRLVARAFAFVADQFHVGQKLHLDGDSAVTLAVFAAAAGDVKREVSSGEATFLRFRKRSKQIADDVESFDVSDRIRARSAADWRLIDENYFVKILIAFNLIPRNSSRNAAIGLPQGSRQCLIKHIMQQRGFSGSRNAGDCD